MIAEAVDSGSFIEVQPEFAQNVVVGFAKLAGRTVGLFRQPGRASTAASLDIDSSDKAARFLRFCDAFNVPIVSLVDVPGFLPGITQEHGGIIRHGARSCTRSPRRRPQGGADHPQGVRRRLHRHGLQVARLRPRAGVPERGDARSWGPRAPPTSSSAATSPPRRTPPPSGRKKVEEFRETVMNPFIAAGHGFIDDVIEPAAMRIELIRSIEMLARKREDRPAKKHGNIPL